MLENMSCTIEQAVDDSTYVRMFYPTDDELRNRGNLTLIAPQYVMQFSGLLKLSQRVIHNCLENDEVVIPGKQLVIQQMKDVMVKEDKDYVKTIISLSETMLHNT